MENVRLRCRVRRSTASARQRVIWKIKKIINGIKIMTPRGIRNNNPLNIRRSKDQWRGMAEVQLTVES